MPKFFGNKKCEIKAIDTAVKNIKHSIKLVDSFKSSEDFLICKKGETDIKAESILTNLEPIVGLNLKNVNADDEKSAVKKFVSEFDGKRTIADLYNSLKKVKKIKKTFGSRINPLCDVLDEARKAYEDKVKQEAFGAENYDKLFNGTLRSIKALLNRLDGCFDKKEDITENKKATASNLVEKIFKSIYNLALLDKKIDKKSKSKSKNKTGLIPWFVDNQSAGNAGDYYNALYGAKGLAAFKSKAKLFGKSRINQIYDTLEAYESKIKKVCVVEEQNNINNQNEGEQQQNEENQEDNENDK